jgi:hypothetical protein
MALMETKLPDTYPRIQKWLVVGIDPSMSRTGYATMIVEKDPTGPITAASWKKVGSVKAKETSAPLWIRALLMAMYIKKQIKETLREFNLATGSGPEGERHDMGLLISMEFPTPQNDFLVALNRMIHSVFFTSFLTKLDGISVDRKFGMTRLLTTNASTLRSVMGLKQRGAKNKGENILRAYDFVDRNVYPGLDTDACDAVLLTMMGRYTASIIMERPEEVPANFFFTLCNAKQEIKGKGVRQRTVTKGILHRGEYWYNYASADYTLTVKDAKIPIGKRLESVLMSA